MEILFLSSRGPLVSLLQLTLNELGFNAGAVDGIFGQQTQTALKAFQRANGIEESGITWPQTWDALAPHMVQHDIYTTIPYSSAVLQVNLQGLLRKFPYIQISTIGYSVMQKRISAIKIGTGPVQVMYNASHHANEWITTPLVMKFVQDYARAYTAGGTIFDIPARELYEKTTLTVVPMVNPDGVDLVTGQIKPGTYFYGSALSMNNPPVDFPSGWKANIRGVDLNLNYPAGWETAKEIKFANGYTQPSPRDYVGPYPLSEPESSAMASLTEQNSFALTISYHTQGEVIYWKFEDYVVPRAEEIVRAMADASGYIPDETPRYSAYAGYKDWFIQQYQLPGYTVEAGSGINPLPIADFDSIYERNIGIMALGLSLA